MERADEMEYEESNDDSKEQGFGKASDSIKFHKKTIEHYLAVNLYEKGNFFQEHL